MIDLACGPAICRSLAGPERGSARRLLVGQHDVPALALPKNAPADTPGRVVSLGRFHDLQLGSALSSALPADLRLSLRDEFEWYVCRGAFFHNDAHYGDVLFGAWCVGGPSRDLVFARCGMRVELTIGTWVVFDPFEPHGVIDRGADRYQRDHYIGAPASAFIGFELALDGAVRAAFGIGAPVPAAPVLASDVAVHAETGALRSVAEARPARPATVAAGRKTRAAVAGRPRSAPRPGRA